MRHLVALSVVLIVALVVAGNALAADQLRTHLQTQDRIFQQDRTCLQDCVCDYPNCTGDCPQTQLQQRDQDCLNGGASQAPDWGWLMWQYGWGQ